MLHTIPLPICNVYLLRGERPVLVDTGRPKDAARIEAALGRLGVALPDVALLLHTHAHWDHYGSTCELSRRTEAPVAVHRADAGMMRRGDNGVLRPTCLTSRLLRPLLNLTAPPVEPMLLLDGDFDLAPFGVAAKVIATPGHTSGSISVLTAEGDAIVGDLLMGGVLGGKVRRGRPGLHYFAEDVPRLFESVKRVLALKPRRICVSHGGPLDPGDVERWLVSST